MSLWSLYVEWVRATPADDTVLVYGPFILGYLTYLVWGSIVVSIDAAFPSFRCNNRSEIISGVVVAMAYMVVFIAV